MHFLIRKNENLETQLGWTKNETQLGKPLSYFNWEESVKRTVYGRANTLKTFQIRASQFCRYVSPKLLMDGECLKIALLPIRFISNTQNVYIKYLINIE